MHTVTNKSTAGIGHWREEMEVGGRGRAMGLGGGGGSGRYVGYQIRYTGCRGNIKRKLGVFDRKVGTKSKI